MTMPKAILILASFVLATACDTQVSGPRRGPPPGLAQLHDDACMAVDECRQLTEACGGDEACLEAINAVVEEPDGQVSTIPSRLVERYAP